MKAACENGAFSDTTLACTSGFTLATYTYDALSRRTNLDFAPSTGGAHVTYAYTDAGDLTALDHDLSGTGDDAQFDFTYTPAHQVASMAQSDPDFLWQATGTCADTYTHNDLNQYPTIAWCGGAAQTHTWSPNGNLTGANIDGTGWTYTYDPENRLLTAGKTGLTVTYAYDPLDHRASRAATSQSTVFFLGDDTRDDEIGDYQPDGTLIQRYIPGPAIDRPIAMVTAGGTRTYFHTDRLGSVIVSGDTSAKTEGPYTYDSYGRPCGATGTSTCTLASSGEPFRFTGRRLDPDTRLYYYRARYYSFDLGRFLQTDAVGYEADLNLYTYVGNDPVNGTDPTGACPPRVCGAEGDSYSGIGGAAGCDGSRIGAAAGSICGGSDFDPTYKGSTAWKATEVARQLVKPYIERYNERDRNYHRFEVGAHSMCQEDISGCTVGHVGPISDEEAIPLTLPFYRQPDENGNYYILFVDPINHFRRDEHGASFSVNNTLPGHRYHPGTVVSVTFEYRQRVWLYTVGVGTGGRAAENYFTGKVLFNVMHAVVWRRVTDEIYGGNRGAW